MRGKSPCSLEIGPSLEGQHNYISTRDKTLHNVEQTSLRHKLIWPNLTERFKHGKAYLIDISFPQLQHSQVVEGLSVIVVGCQSQPKALVAQTGIPTRHSQMANVVPNLG